MLDTQFGTGPVSGTYAAILTGTAPADYAAAKTQEVTGGSPAYARKQVNLAASAAGSKALAANPVFDIPSGTTITGYALWRVATAGAAADYMGSQALTQAETFGGQGTYTLTAETISL